MSDSECYDLWWVFFSPQPEELYVPSKRDPENKEFFAVLRALFGQKIGWREIPTTDENISLFKLSKPLFQAVVKEFDMKPFMSVMRANKFTGSYRKAGTKKQYQF